MFNGVNGGFYKFPGRVKNERDKRSHPTPETNHGALQNAVPEARPWPLTQRRESIAVLIAGRSIRTERIIERRPTSPWWYVTNCPKRRLAQKRSASIAADIPPLDGGGGGGGPLTSHRTVTVEFPVRRLNPSQPGTTVYLFPPGSA